MTEQIRIWHQSFTVLEDVPSYAQTLRAHVDRVASAGTQIQLNGMKPGSYPSAYPGTHIAHNYLSGLHKEQFIQAGLEAVDRGFDAIMICTLVDTAYEELRSLVDIPVVAYGQTSLAVGSQLGDTIGIVGFLTALTPQVRRNARNYNLHELLGPVIQIDGTFDTVNAAYADPENLIGRFFTSARAAIAQGATVIVPGEGPLNLFLAHHGISEVDGVAVVDSIGALVAMAELRVRLHRVSGTRPSRRGFYGTQPERALVDSARAFYGIPQHICRPDCSDSANAAGVQSPRRTDS